MKSMLVIGLGDFGHHLVRNLIRMKNEVLIVDKNEAAIEDVKGLVNSALIADCTSRAVLEKLGVSNFDMCFVCIDSDFKSSLIVVSLLKELGAKYVVCQTDDDILGKFFLKNGADEVIYPNSDSAVRCAVKYSSEHIFDYIELKSDYSVYEITPLKEWVGKSILESQVRQRYDTYIIGILDKNGGSNIMPSPATVIEESDHLMVLAHEKTMEKLVKIMER